MYYYTYDVHDGKITAFYNDAVHQHIPDTAIAISDNEWRELVTNHAQWIFDADTQQLTQIDEAQDELTESIRNWELLVARLRGTVVFGKVYESAKVDSFLNAAFTLFLTTLSSSNPDINDFNFAIVDVVTIMGQRFTSEDIAFINQTLHECGFETIQF